ncbi:MAG TPA: helix-turn-helix domain-containing protein [Burkholderiales bacterium]|nr:helix-turn-helix domain-containing protein [Burkholderiales bacterium]
MIRPMTIEQCPVKVTADIIGGKWKPLILYFLKQAGGTLRYGELRRYMGNVSKKVLTEQIRQLERDDIVARKAHADGNSLRVEYTLTAHGNTLRPILKLMCDWGEEHRSRYGDRARGGSGSGVADAARHERRA